MISNCPTSNTFGARMAEVIEDLGMSHAQAARLAGIHRSQIHKYVTGDERPKEETLGKITVSWHIPAFVFYMDRDQSAPFVEAAKKSLEKIA